MKKIFVIFSLIFCLFFLLSCHTTKNVIEKEKTEVDTLQFHQRDSIQKEKIKELNKKIYIYKDSLTKIKALNEKSSNILSSLNDTSSLETSYAKSFAFVNDKGNLIHSLWNKDSIPVNIKYIYIHETNEKDSTSNTQINQNDSTNIVNNHSNEKTDKEEKVVVKELTFWEKGKYIGIGVPFGAILTLLLYFFIKSKKKG